MKKMVCAMLITVLLSGVILVGAAAKKEEIVKDTTPKIKWEYMVYPKEGGKINFSVNSQNRSKVVNTFLEDLNKLGQDGWELIELGSSCAILKRQKP